MSRAKRVGLSKKVRFEVFKRDSFTCQYCGAHPPATILHVDHIRPVAEGGTNEIDNLITACQPCNSGKGAIPLEAVPDSLTKRKAAIEEREEQIRGYNEVMERRAARLEGETWEVAETLSPGAVSEDKGFPRTDLISIRRFIEKLGFYEVNEAAEIAYSKVRRSEYQRFKYFCGVCWKKLRDTQDEG